MKAESRKAMEKVVKTIHRQLESHSHCALCRLELHVFPDTPADQTTLCQDCFVIVLRGREPVQDEWVRPGEFSSAPARIRGRLIGWAISEERYRQGREVSNAIREDR